MKTQPDHPYHHGDIPTQLVLAGIRALRTQEIDSLSLRELSKELGVSYNAPRRHFASKQAFLDALALEGYRLLSQALESVTKDFGREFDECLKAIARTCVRFAVENGVLFDLMVAAGRRLEAPAELKEAFLRTWQAGPDLIRKGQKNGFFVDGDADDLFRVFYCLFVGMVSTRETDVDRSMTLFLNGLRA